MPDGNDEICYYSWNWFDNRDSLLYHMRENHMGVMLSAKNDPNYHNPNDNTTKHNFNAVVGLDMKMTANHPTPPPHKNSTVVFRSLRLTFIDMN